MPHLPNEDLEKFDRVIRDSFKRIGGGKLAIDTKDVRKAVRSNKAAAHRYVELYCAMAASQPGYLQTAMMVASAYQVEFEDDSLFTMVTDRARKLGAMEHLRSIGVGPSMEDLTRESAEREAARRWWRSSKKKEGMCDACRAVLRRGDGYLIDGRLQMLGETKINLGIELLCRSCFEKHWNDARDPSGGGDDYVRIG